MKQNAILIARVGERDTALACSALRRRVFLAAYGPMGLRDWPGEPDEFDDGPGFLAAWERDQIVGTILLHHDKYDGTRPFWLDRFGVTVPELIPDALGQRIGEVGRLAVDKSTASRPLAVALALANAVVEQVRQASVAQVIGTAMSAPMLAFYQRLVQSHRGGFRVHPRKGHAHGIDMTYMVLTIGRRDAS